MLEEREPTTTDASPAPDPMAAVDTDPASRSLAGALHTSFILLSVIMVILLGFYVFSGVFTVGANERAVVLRFGRVLGATEAVRGDVLDAGLHFSWPLPIDEVVRVPTWEQELAMDSFWHYERPGDAGKKQEEKRPVAAGLRPLFDGSLLTRGQNLVHVKWVVTYQVKPDDNSVLDFAANVLRSDVADARAIIRLAIEEGSVRSAARFPSWAIAGGHPMFRDKTRQVAQEILDELGTGLNITNLSLTAHSPPLQTMGAFNAVSAAESDRQKMIDAAGKQATSILQGAAGDNWRAIKDAIDRYNQTGAEADYQAVIARIEDPGTTGEAHKIIRDAERDQADMIAHAQQAYDQFSQYLAAYKKNPHITVSRLWTDTLEAILAETTNVKTYVPGNRPTVLHVSHDPAVWRRIKRLEAQQVRREVNPWEGQQP
ncbi:MAG: protease modulator HflK [Planctomycetes bacterium]|nr:protease modulator HflK [Planctomycetota bacterium]